MLCELEKGTYQNWVLGVKKWEVLGGLGGGEGVGESRHQSPRNKGGKAYLEM